VEEFLEQAPHHRQAIGGAAAVVAERRCARLKRAHELGDGFFRPRLACCECLHGRDAERRRCHPAVGEPETLDAAFGIEIEAESGRHRGDVVENPLGHLVEALPARQRQPTVYSLDQLAGCEPRRAVAGEELAQR